MQTKILMAKVGMDGHDAGVKLVAAALRDAGMDVVYTGPFQTVQSVVETAIQEDVDVIGISSLASDHVLVPKLVELLRGRNADNIKVIVGGVVPDEDATELKQAGVAEVFPPGSTLDSIVHFIRKSMNAS
ncbi:MAG: cobalamin B12-binding domain-containing protein [Candidatus Methylomirabilia bacterium]